jgi:hypothetical protein
MAAATVLHALAYVEEGLRGLDSSATNTIAPAGCCTWTSGNSAASAALATG